MRGLDSRHLEAVRRALDAESLSVLVHPGETNGATTVDFVAKFNDGSVATYRAHPSEFERGTVATNFPRYVAETLFRARLTQLVPS